MPTCTVCGVSVSSVAGLYLHVKIVHQDLELVFRCREDNCLRPFRGWTKFRRHLITVHNVPIHAPGNADNSFINPIVSCSEFSDDHFEEGINECGDKEDGKFRRVTLGELENEMLNLSLSFASKLYANPKVPRSYIQEVIESTQDLLEGISSVSKDYLFSAMEKNDLFLSQEAQADITNFTSYLKEPFGCVLSSEYRRMKLIESNGILVEALDFVMGDRLDNILFQGRIIQDRAEVKGKFIPMRETLREFFSLPGVLNSVLNYTEILKKEKDSGIISNFMQGELWRKKLEHFEGKIVFPFFISFDDFETNNALGSHAGVSKLGAVYFSLPCLPPQFRSKLENIFLTMLFYTSDRSACGNDSVFQVLVDEINYLQQNGVTIHLSNGETKQIFFALGLVLGDNLGLNSVLGFVESFRANHYCRTCKIHREDAEKCCVEDQRLFRTKEQYDRDVDLNNVTETGVKENSIWNLVMFFHVVFNYSFDIMHDLLEGVCKYDMGHILSHYIEEKKMFTLDQLNSKLKSFNYAVNNISNRPGLLSQKDLEKKRLPYSASEMHAFVLIFPHLVGDLIQINSSDEVWTFYLILREILDIVFAKSIEIECAELLSDLVYQHHRLYMKLFKDTLKPKFHHMCHYKSAIFWSGALSHLSSMRFEAKHRVLKAVAGGTCSRVNIPHTICFREQLIVSLRFTRKRVLEDTVDLGPGERLDTMCTLDTYYLFRETIPPNFTGPYLQVPWAEVKGVPYRLGSCLVLDDSKNRMPLFGVIEHIVVNEEGTLVLVCNEFETKEFVQKMHSYRVQPCKWKYSCFLISSLLFPFPVIHNTLSIGDHYVTLKYSI